MDAVAGVSLIVPLALAISSLRYTPTTAVSVLVGALLCAAAALRRSVPRALIATLVLDSLLVLGCLWSLDEHQHIRIDISPQGYIAHVGDQAFPLSVHSHAGPIGLRLGTSNEDIISAAGETSSVMPGPLAAIGRWVRSALIGPAWAHVMVNGVVSHGSPTKQGPTRERVLRNPRGEIAGPVKDVVWIPGTGTRVSRIDVDAMRPDGTQAVVVGRDRLGRLYAFTLRFDQAYAAWDPAWPPSVTNVSWGLWYHNRLHVLRHFYLHDFAVVDMAQRIGRTVLPSILVELGLTLLILVLYLAIRPLVWWKRSGGTAMSRRRAQTTVIIAAWIAVGGAALASSVGGRMPRVVDSVVYLFEARMLVAGHVAVTAPRLPQFFSMEYIIVAGHHMFGQYPIGWPLVLAIGTFFHSGWLVNPFLAGLIVPQVYLIGGRVYSRRVGVLAACLLAVSPFFLFLSGSFMSHTSCLFFLVTFANLLTMWLRQDPASSRSARRDMRLLGPAGLALGLGILTRELDAIVFAIPLLVSVAVQVRLRRCLRLAWLGSGLALPACYQLWSNWHLTGSPLRNPYTLWASYRLTGFGPNVGPHGFTFAQGLWNTAFNLQELQVNAFGWPFYVCLACVALPFVLGRASVWDWTFAAGIALNVSAYVAYFHPGGGYVARYYFCSLPALALLAARGFQEMVHLPLRLPLGASNHRFAARVIPSLLLGFLLAYNLTAYMPPDVAFYSRFDCQSPKIRDAASQAHIHHALVFVHQTGNYYYCPYSNVFDNNDLSFNGDVVYARDLGASDRKLIALYPGRAVYRLRGSHLSPMPTALTAGQTGATPARVWARPTGVGGAGRGV